MMSISPDLIDRRLAASALDKNILVLAGAGTGKTTLLIDRLTLLILGKEIPVERIVALTFTKKAAEEMRVRLEERLRKMIDGSFQFDLLDEFYAHNKSKRSALAAKALDDIPKSQIGTIHSFAAHLLRLYPLQAGVDPTFREDEGTLFEMIFEKEWINWLKEELGENPKRNKLWRELLKSADVSDFKTLAKALASPAADLERILTPVSLTAIFSSLEKELGELIIRYSFPEKAPSFGGALRALETALDKGRFPENIDSVLTPFENPPKAWKEAKEELKKLKKRAAQLAQVDEKFMRRATEAVLPFVKRMRRELNRKGAVSFDGLLVFARNLVRDHAEVRNALKKRFETFLVDEFQDTDPIQGEILFYLSESLGSSSPDWKSVDLAPGRLFVVGDPKQSIYRFRGADVAAFEAFERHMIKNGAEVATLSTNFRSRPPLIDFYNQLFPPNMIEKAFIQPAYVPLVPGREEPLNGTRGPKETPVEMILATGADSGLLTAHRGREAEAETIARWITEKVPASFKYSDITILFRSSHAFIPYLEAMRRWNIPYLVEGEKSFYLTSEIVDFLNLISVLADPADKLALVGVLRSPVGGLTDAEILDLHEKNFLDIRFPPRIHEKKTGPLYQLLRHLAARAVTNSVSDTVLDILHQSRLMELSLYTSYGEQALANLLKLHGLAKKWGQEAPVTLKLFVRRLKDYREEERKEGENPLADVTYDAVKIMTIHKAKGLEFPVVILPNLSAVDARNQTKPAYVADWRSGLAGLRSPDAKKINAAMFMLDEEIRQREEAEEVRVFFVAATRAKEKLIVLRSHIKNSGRFSSYLRKAGFFAEPGMGTVGSAGVSLPVKTVGWNEDSTFRKEPVPCSLSNEWNPTALAEQENRRRKDLESLSGQRLILTPSHLMRESEKIREVNEESAPPVSRAILIGHICHKVMEDWNFNEIPKSIAASLNRLLKKAAGLYELTPGQPDYQNVMDECEKILSAFFSSEAYNHLQSVKVLGREIPFCFPLEGEPVKSISLKAASPKGVGFDGPRVMRGVIDLLYEENGRVVVADYKTNQISTTSTKKLIEHYRPQAAVYRQAVSRSLGKEVDFELIFLRDGSKAQIR